MEDAGRTLDAIRSVSASFRGIERRDCFHSPDIAVPAEFYEFFIWVGYVSLLVLLETGVRRGGLSNLSLPT